MDLPNGLDFTYGYIVEEALDTKRADMPVTVAVFALIGDRLERGIINQREAHLLVDAAFDDFVSPKWKDAYR